MNNVDFEKTQIWARNLADNVLPLSQGARAVPPVQPGRLAFKKPVLKPLTKEEKIILATGGALAVGLGAIVITSLIDDEVQSPIAKPNVNLNAPTLSLSDPLVKPEEPELPAAPHRTPPPRPAQHEPRAQAHGPKPELHHALLEIPDVPEVATRHTDEQTFIDAFNTARAEVGPAGLFCWKNTFYSTFTDKEWASVSADRKAHWLEGAEPIITPVEMVEAPQPADHQYVVVSERGDVTWTGIDRDEDGQAEILMARIDGQSPMVLFDTDGDKMLDTRYDYDPETGKTFASAIEPIAMSTSEIPNIEEVVIGPGMGFFNEAHSTQAPGKLPVSIVADGNTYVVSLDADKDNTIDAITYFTDGRGPIVGLDQDHDGHIDTGYIYDDQADIVRFQQTDPMDEMLIGPPEYSHVAPAYGEENAFPGGQDPAELAFEEAEDDLNDEFDAYFDKGTDHSEGYHS